MHSRKCYIISDLQARRWLPWLQTSIMALYMYTKVILKNKIRAAFSKCMKTNNAVTTIKAFTVFICYVFRTFQQSKSQRNTLKKDWTTNRYVQPVENMTKKDELGLEIPTEIWGEKKKIIKEIKAEWSDPSYVLIYFEVNWLACCEPRFCIW